MTTQQISTIYASEADVLNMALFGMTAKQWRDSHPGAKGNIRDYANVSQLVCLSNLENLNAVFIADGLFQAERLARLNNQPDAAPDRGSPNGTSETAGDRRCAFKRRTGG